MKIAEVIKILRDKTGAGIADIKRALEEAGGDQEKAEAIIMRRFGAIAQKKSGRETRSGIVDAYIHLNGRVGSLVALYCETDFVARNPAFKELAHDIAMQVVAMNPLYLSLDHVPREIWDVEKSRFETEAMTLGKPSHVIQEIVEGKLKAYFGAVTLMEQPFIKDQDKTVAMVIQEAIGKFGENIKIGKFVKFEL